MAKYDQDTDLDWRGWDETSPCSDPKEPLNREPERPEPKGNDWKGMRDGTPASMPMDPNKEPM